MRYTKILGVGSYLPPRVLTNNDLCAFMDTSDEWIQQRTGIKQRHWVEGTTTTSDLALEASLRALDQAKIKKEELDMIILATLSADHEFPGTACFLQAKLDLAEIPALDVRQQCTGFIYGLTIADHFIKLGTYNKILLVGAEVHSKGMDKSNRGREVTVLFGDGAGAVVLAGVDGNYTKKDSCILGTCIHADGHYARELWIQAPSMAYDGARVTPEILARGEHFAKMNGKTVFVNAARRMPEVLFECLKKCSLALSDIDLFVFHQANLRINEMVAKQLGIPENKVFNTIDRFGNTTAATIPIGLDYAIKEGKLKPGMLVASSAFGSGFTWGAAVYRI
ncbi:ketoacyl-ACP synthase III [Candidatus Nomurabacteria bacterium]|nr:ketoacyl-ACP synthase III [Candidatus Nomurabacteria bacterium]